MAIIDISIAQQQLLTLLEAAAKGEEIVIAMDGRPVAKVVPLTHSRVEREPGGMEGQIWMSDSFDDPLSEDMQRAFEGG
jgi:prevent-host-death family protein